MEAIRYARDANIDVVLVDTAGRMQDNEPLMKALSKVGTITFIFFYKSASGSENIFDNFIELFFSYIVAH